MSKRKLIPKICCRCSTAYEGRSGSKFCSRSCSSLNWTAEAHVPPEDRFWKNVDKRGAEECWPWTGKRSPGGYGKFSVKGASVRANRFAFQITFGEIAPGVLVCHHCDNPACCNPAHLYAGSPQSNMDDRSARGRVNSALGERVGSSKLKAADVDEICRKHSEGASLTQLGKLYNMTSGAIHGVISGRTWSHVPRKEYSRPSHHEQMLRHNASSRLTVEQVTEIRRRFHAGEVQSNLAKEFAVSTSAIWFIVHEKTWKQVTPCTPTSSTTCTSSPSA